MPGIDYRQARAQIRLDEVLELIGYRPHRLVGQVVQRRRSTVPVATIVMERKSSTERVRSLDRRGHIAV